ncbi:MAG: glycosyltransferase family 2 protein [Phycisphaerales bacterium]|nr:MAG: glycosyltransferase family 2 protein [Phycisphaerales bacterium]
MNPTVAVIISTYNASEHLARVLDGYLAQSRPADELLVADDGSDWRTAKVVSEFASKARFPVSHVYQEDLGFRAAKIRNEAVKASSGEYLIFTDGDCVPHRRFVEDHVRIMRPGRFIQGKRMLVSKRTSTCLTRAGSLQLLKLCLKGEVSGCHHLVRLPGLTIRNKGLRGIKSCNFAVYRKDFLAVNGFNEDFVGWGREDSELAVRLLKYGLTRRDAPFSAIVYHLWHKENPKDALSRNDTLLAKAVQSSDFYCRNGISKRKT